MAAATPRRDISAELREAFLQELATRFPGGQSPGGCRFSDGRWFSGISPAPGDPYVDFDGDNIMVHVGERGFHRHFFPPDHTAEGFAVAAREALAFLEQAADWLAAARLVPDSKRRAIGAAWGALIGTISWVLLLFSGPFQHADLRIDVSDIFALVSLVVVGATVGAIFRRPPP